jgi:hypothetical protein
MPGAPPAGNLDGDPSELKWCRQRWLGWQPADEAVAAIPRSALGLYRLRSAGSREVAYIGEGKIRARLQAHLAKTAKVTTLQGQLLADAAPLECPWVAGPWLRHQRLELETDLIGAFVLSRGQPAVAQFTGSSRSSSVKRFTAAYATMLDSSCWPRALFMTKGQK